MARRLLPALKITFALSLAVLWWLTYTWINDWNATPERAVFLAPRPVDIFPWIIQPLTAPLYVGILALLMVWGLVLCFPGPAYWHLFAAIMIGTAIGFAIFLVWPLNMQRPEFAGNQWGEEIMRWVFAVDASANCFPSYHAFFAVLFALFISQESSNRRSAVIAWFLASLVLVTTITTGQHYLIDVLGGAILAWVCFRMTLLLHVGAKPQQSVLS